MSTEIDLSLPAAEALLPLMPVDILWDLLKAPDFSADAFFRGGFQVSRKSIEKRAVQARIALALHRDAAFAGLFCEAARSPWALWAGKLGMFDEHWLCRHWPELMRSGGGVCLAVAFALDERPSLRRRGMRVLNRQGIWATLPCTDEASLAHAFARLLPPDLQQLPPESQASCGDHVQDPAEDSRELREVRNSLDSHRRKLRDVQTELRASTADFAQREKALHGDIRAERVRVEGLEASAAEKIQNAIVEIRRSFLRIPPHLVASVQASAVSTERLLDTAATALARQAETDERHGLLSSLQGDLARLDHIFKQLADSIQDSLAVLPETRTAYQAVMSEREEITERLRELRENRAETDSLSTYLLACIRGAHLVENGASDLDAVENILGNELIPGFLGPDSLALLRGDLRERRTALVELNVAAGSSCMSTQSDDAEAPVPKEIWDVGRAIQQASRDRTAVRIFIDGYNAIRRVEKLAELEDTAGLPASRAAFVELCRSKAGHFASIEVVFDGAGALSERVADRGVTVVYSSAIAESQNADIYLTARLHALNKDDCDVWLVTDDFGLRDQVKSCCDAYIPPIHLFSFLSGHGGVSSTQ